MSKSGFISSTLRDKIEYSEWRQHCDSLIVSVRDGHEISSTNESSGYGPTNQSQAWKLTQHSSLLSVRLTI